MTGARLSAAIGIREGESGVVARICLLFAALEAGRGLAEVGVDTLILNRSGSAALPPLFIALGIFSLVVSLLVGAALARFRRDRFYPGLFTLVAAILATERLLAAGGSATIYPILWVSVYAAGLVGSTAAWTIAGAVFDARQAKRLFPLATSAAIVGGFVGMLLAGPVARLVGTENLVVADALLLAVPALAARSIGDRLRRGAQAGPRVSISEALGAGFRYTVSSPLIRLVAIAYVLFAVLMFSVTFPFLRAMSGAFPDEADLAGALGLVSAGVTAMSFVVSVTLANRVYRRFGVATAALALPVVYLAGFGLWLVRFDLTTAIIVRVVLQVTQRGISNAAWSAFFNVVPAERRGQVLAFVDGVPGQVGTALSGILLLGAGALGQGNVLWLGFIGAALCTLVVFRARRGYGRSLVRTLREGLGEQVLEGGPGLSGLARDPHVASDLRRAAASPRAGDRRLAADLLGRLGVRGGGDALVELAGDPDPAVRSAALSALAGLAAGAGASTEAAIAVVRHGFDDEVPAVRAAAVGGLAAMPGGRLPEDVVERAARDASPIVRAELAVALVRNGEEDRPHRLLAAMLDSEQPDDRLAGLDAVRRLGGHAPSARIVASLEDASAVVRAAAVRAVGVVVEGVDDQDARIIAALADPDRTVRSAAAEVLRDRESPVDPILRVVESGSEDSQMAALAALEGRAAEVAAALIPWAEEQIERATVLRRHGMALARVTDSTSGRAAQSAAFLRFLLERRSARIEERLLAVLTVLGVPEAGGLIRRCLRSGDPQVRAQALEALETLGDRRLGRAAIALLEAEESVVPGHLDEILDDLAGDPDPWVRALALRTLSEHLSGRSRAVLDRVDQDPEPIVRQVVGAADRAEGGGVAETGATLDEIERIMFLRGVPLFGELPPEDLQRLARAATERSYPGGSELVREGELGDELVVIVEGSVRVVHLDDTGERFIRTYEAGDHIGELAVLRERPRAATVIAAEPGVRGLVIGGAALKAILQERPEAAWAMLATLAERLTYQ
jgi:HEAT repeat protein